MTYAIQSSTLTWARKANKVNKQKTISNLGMDRVQACIRLKKGIYRAPLIVIIVYKQST